MSGLTAVSASRKWAMLAAGVAAQATSSIAVNGAAFLIPTLISDHDWSLLAAGTVAAAPLAGVLLTLLLWGWAVDQIGERRVLTLGLAGTVAAGALATTTSQPVPLSLALALTGAFAASTAAASGRVVVGWFPADQRGLAMGIRQMAQPLGVGAAAATIAPIAHDFGLAAALWVAPVACALALVAVLAIVIDPPRPPRPPEMPRSEHPYAGWYLWRIHGVSVLLVIPQFVVWTYSLVWLIEDRGWEPAAAGAFVAAIQLGGGAGRIGVGWVSDRVGSRVRPMRQVAVGATAAMALLALTSELGLAVSVALLAVANAVTVADNGLAFTAVAERAGPFWGGRALGLQNTSQYAAAAAVAPAAALLIDHAGFPVTWAVTAVAAALAIPLVPRD